MFSHDIKERDGSEHKMMTQILFTLKHLEFYKKMCVCARPFKCAVYTANRRTQAEAWRSMGNPETRGLLLEWAMAAPLPPVESAFPCPTWFRSWFSLHVCAHLVALRFRRPSVSGFSCCGASGHCPSVLPATRFSWPPPCSLARLWGALHMSKM